MDAMARHGFPPCHWVRGRQASDGAMCVATPPGGYSKRALKT